MFLNFLAIAMILNLIMAAVGGFLLPYILRKFGYDPAISGGVIITTITDISLMLSSKIPVTSAAPAAAGIPPNIATYHGRA